jgi:hypothetical protein
MKRLVVGVFVSALSVFGVAPVASAATTQDDVVVKVTRAKQAKPIKIDWDSSPVDTGFSTQRIDWD